MKGATRLTRINQTTQNKPITQTSSYRSQITTSNNTSNAPIKITIKTTYEKGYNNPNEKLREKPEENNGRHFHKLTMEERKKFTRGLRPSHAQREADELERQRQNQKEEMIEIIDKTDYSKINNQNIKLRPNKKVLINRKKETNTESKPITIKSGSNQQNLTSNANQINNRRNPNQQNKENIQLIPNKRKVLRNQKVQPAIQVPQIKNLRNYSKKEEKPVINSQDSKKSARNNTVSHTIIEKRKTEPKPYVLNERRTDIIKFSPRALQKYNDSIIGNKDEPYRSNNNHNMTVIKNVTKEVKTILDIPEIHHRYKYIHDPNLKNTSSHKIDATKKEPKKEVVVQPRQLTVIRSVIPSRLRHLTENNENINKTNKPSNYGRKIQTDKKIPTNNITQKIGNVIKDNKTNQQGYQPRINYKKGNEINTNTNNRINIEPQKPTRSYVSRFNKSSTSQPQSQQNQPIPSYQNQNTRIKREYPKQTENKYPLQQKT